jgi:hypothetical protein
MMMYVSGEVGSIDRILQCDKKSYIIDYTCVPVSESETTSNRHMLDQLRWRWRCVFVGIQPGSEISLVFAPACSNS